MSENQNTDHLELVRLLQQAKPLTEPLFPDQQKKWAAGSPLAQEISEILVRHPEYYVFCLLCRNRLSSHVTPIEAA